MENRFEFDGGEVRALLDESHAARERLMTEAQRLIAAGIDLAADPGQWDGEVNHPGTGAPPGLWLMNDHGVYLRSNARKREAGSVAYAAGFRSGVQVGDEPMREFLDGAQLAPVQAGDTLVVTVTEQKLRLSLRRPG
ncbi:MAG TPA: hypothetical protein VGB24_24465 [Longimicrobium sp.]|jgi:hypothetical protein|uniref:hypothetical protein n=1 Tax=Longimicrobium sp. TaxID=2029185 RepID=UPI002ED9901C